jgi:predicted metal-dependent peptidase
MDIDFFTDGFVSDFKNYETAKINSKEDRINKENHYRLAVVKFVKDHVADKYLDAFPTDGAVSDPHEFAYPTPRSWEMVVKILSVLDENEPEYLEELVKGCIGETAGNLFIKFIENYKGLEIDIPGFVGREEEFRLPRPDRHDHVSQIMASVVFYLEHDPEKYMELWIQVVNVLHNENNTYGNYASYDGIIMKYLYSNMQLLLRKDLVKDLHEFSKRITCYNLLHINKDEKLSKYIVEYSPEFRLLLAAKKIGNEFPYYSPATARVRFKQDNKTPTMGINCSLVIAYNEEFIKKLTDEELTAVVLHEIFHYMHGHHERYMNSSSKDTLPFKIHNMAMDIEINEFINNLPEGVFRAENFNLPERKSYEEYLLLLKENMQSNVQLQKILGVDGEQEQSQNKMPVNDLNLDGYTDDHQDILNKLVEEIEEIKKNIGTESGSDGINRRIQKRKYRWEQVFQNIVSTKITEITVGFKYRTFEKANRRYVHTPDIILPVFIDRKIKISLAIIMDISGSMGSKTDKMYGVMKSMVDILDMEIDITILEVDTDVENIMRGFDLNRETVESKDGGGTDMGAGLYYIQENKIEADLIVVMTDSYTPWPNPPILADKTSLS